MYRVSERSIHVVTIQTVNFDRSCFSSHLVVLPVSEASHTIFPDTRRTGCPGKLFPSVPGPTIRAVSFFFLRFQTLAPTFSFSGFEYPTRKYRRKPKGSICVEPFATNSHECLGLCPESCFCNINQRKRSSLWRSRYMEFLNKLTSNKFGKVASWGTCTVQRSSVVKSLKVARRRSKRTKRLLRPRIHTFTLGYTLHRSRIFTSPSMSSLHDFEEKIGLT